MRPLTHRPDLVSLTAVTPAPVPGPTAAISYVTVVERKVVTVTRGQLVTVRAWTSPFPTRNYGSIPSVSSACGVMCSGKAPVLTSNQCKPRSLA